MAVEVEQNKVELAWLLTGLAGCKSFLEIGSRSGGMLEAFADVCAPGARICSIDIGYGVDGDRHGFVHVGLLEETIDLLRDRGFDVHVLFGDSRSKEAITWAHEMGPFNFVFIDGDHSYEGVKADWLNYGQMAPVIGFHDIMNDYLGVRKFWFTDIMPRHSTVMRYVATSDMGIGLVFNEE